MNILTLVTACNKVVKSVGAEFYTAAVWSVFAHSTRAMRLSNKKSLGKDSVPNWSREYLLRTF